MLKILYIDDNKSLTKLFKLMSEDYDFKPFIANSMWDGIDLARKIKPDVIITDIFMEDEYEGLKLMAQLKTDVQTYDIPVVGCSVTYADLGKKVFLLGAQKFVNDKPYNIEKLNYILEGIAPKLNPEKKDDSG